MTERPLGFILTIESGLCCQAMSEFHKEAEDLLGRSIWTHEFADKDLWLEMKTALLIEQDDGHYQRARTEHPVDSFRRLAPNTPLLVVDQDEVRAVPEVDP